MTNKPSKITRIIYWSWTALYFLITLIEISQLSSRSFGEQKIFMLVITVFLFIIFIAIYITILINNLYSKYFSKYEFIICVIGIIIFVSFFLTLKNNANILIE